MITSSGPRIEPRCSAGSEAQSASYVTDTMPLRVPYNPAPKMTDRSSEMLGVTIPSYNHWDYTEDILLMLGSRPAALTPSWS